MKKLFGTLLLWSMIFMLSACGGTQGETAFSISGQTSAGVEASPSSEPSELSESSEPVPSAEVSVISQMQEQPDHPKRRISIQFGENVVIYELNDGTAAASLYEQLPLTIEVEDFSTNEKIFYPPQELDVSDSPLAQGGAGTLAYYAPWGDVVMFFDDYNENTSLYALGQAVSGEELVHAMTGTITIEIAN